MVGGQRTTTAVELPETEKTSLTTGPFTHTKPHPQARLSSLDEQTSPTIYSQSIGVSRALGRRPRLRMGTGRLHSGAWEGKVEARILKTTEDQRCMFRSSDGCTGMVAHTAVRVSQSPNTRTGSRSARFGLCATTVSADGCVGHMYWRATQWRWGREVEKEKGLGDSGSTNIEDKQRPKAYVENVPHEQRTTDDSDRCYHTANTTNLRIQSPTRENRLSLETHRVHRPSGASRSAWLGLSEDDGVRGWARCVGHMFWSGRRLATEVEEEKGMGDGGTGEEPSSEAQRHRATADGRDQVIIVTRERRDAPYAMRWGGRGKVQLGINELGDADEERSVLDVRVDPGKREVQGEVPLA
ncbi:hypothetical protein DFP72DRAFT_1050415 [Ephemerocybe angulata]|uniref:Uncharacterized protein n=1 Tax=Ephemerocybe angulata TaxID=980116 RepID=A0A8H6M064_9AGAR|nr:hypothetical protein DFP72DRAFT_1050415 [Tulosesus angulatus]